MSLVIKREELITSFLLGDLPEQQRKEVEFELLADGDFLDEVLLIEGQLADSLLLGTLPALQQRRLRNVPELRHQVSLTKLLTEVSKARSNDSDDEIWEKALSEVEQNRQLLESMIASDWDGLRTLMLLRRLPQGVQQLHAQLNVGQEPISEILIRLKTTGAIREASGLFSLTALGEECLHALESLS